MSTTAGSSVPTAGGSGAARPPEADAAPATPPFAPLTADQLRRIMPGSGTRADAYVGALNRAMAAHGVTTREQRAALMGQVAAETGNLHSLVENDNFTARQAHLTWRRRFPTIASAAPYAHHPERLTNHVYANRFGNGNPASGDGYRFRGRGFLQVTGRANYAAIGHEADPDRLADPEVAANATAAHWQTQGLNARTATELSRSAYDQISRTVNGGELQSAERWAAYQRALNVH